MLGVRAWFEDLPEPLREQLEQDAAFLAAAGRNRYEALVIEGLQFAPETYWRAATDAVNSRTAELTPLNRPAPIRLVPFRGAAQEPGVAFIHPDTARRVEQFSVEYALLQDSEAARVEVARGFLEW